MIKASPAVIVDGAHNRDAALRLRECVETCLNGRRLIFIMGVFGDKEYGLMTQIMAPLAERIYTVWLPDRSRADCPLPIRHGLPFSLLRILPLGRSRSTRWMT